MADRRMFSKSIIDSDLFLDMPQSAQCLYFHLAMRADDDGFVNAPRKIQRMIGASEDDCRLLVAKQFLVPFDTGVVVIRHWRIHNYIQKDRYKETIYQQEKSTLFLDESGAYGVLDTDCVQIASETDNQVRLGKDSLGKNRLGESNKKRKRQPRTFVPPALQEVEEYARSRNSKVDPKHFYDYFSAGEWVDAKGNPVLNWKQKFISWEKREGGNNNGTTGNKNPAPSAGQNGKTWNVKAVSLD